MKSVEERFWAKVDFTESCWLWTASIARNGYGHFCDVATVPRGAHRIAYEFLVGPIPAGLVIDHLCRVRNCVNVWHLEAVTQLENVHRGHGNASKTHCKRGHDLGDASNLVLSGLRNGRRKCRTCENTRAYEADRTVAA